MRKSLAKLGKQSFVNDKHAPPLDEPIDLRMVEAEGSFDLQVPEGYRRTSQPNEALMLQCVS